MRGPGSIAAPSYEALQSSYTNSFPIVKVTHHVQAACSLLFLLFLVSLSVALGVLTYRELGFVEDLQMAQTLGIFSRSAETEYAWLTDSLKHHCEPLPVYISNDNRYIVMQQLSRCQWAALYHTKNRGRINITDVTDSLYDEEIVLLSDRLGKDHVIAVIDDLEDSSEEVKKRIENSQTTLRDRTRGIFLFTKLEKENGQLLREKVQPIIDLLRRGEETPRKTGRSVEILAVMVLSSIVFQEVYSSPDHRNLVLASLWAAGLPRALFRKPSQYFWFNYRIHSIVSWTVTLASFYNVYRRPSIANAWLSAFWLTSSLKHPRSLKRPLGLERYVLKALGYGLVFYSFRKGWQIRNTAKLSMLIVQAVLCSPAILTAL